MSVSVFDHPWASGLFADDAMLAVWAPTQSLEYMLMFESAWARALGDSGICSSSDAEAAASAIEAAHGNLAIDVERLKTGMAIDGVPVPALVEQLRSLCGTVAVHTGATSQDVIDTALALTLRDASRLIEQRLEQLISVLQSLETRFGDCSIMARTRMQAATPIKVQDRIATWYLPLQAHCERLAPVRARVECVQIGGASGDRAALGNHAIDVVSHVAAQLQLSPTNKAWHNMRESLVDYASFLSLVSGSLGKVGQDIALMAQQGIDEIELSVGGGSSAMAHKKNPVLAELLITLARFNAVQVAGMHQSLIHEQERSGAAWSLEWMILPQIAQATGRSLSAALQLLSSIERMGSLKP